MRDATEISLGFLFALVVLFDPYDDDALYGYGTESVIIQWSLSTREEVRLIRLSAANRTLFAEVLSSMYVVIVWIGLYNRVKNSCARSRF
jgi:hypothetical protein